MKRKIIQLGKATYVASLPAKWMREHGLEKGDYLEVEEEKGDLVLRTKKVRQNKITSLDFRNSNTKLAITYLETVYDLGYEQVEIVHSPFLEEYKTHKKINTPQFIQQVVNNRFIGLEIVEQSERRTLLRDLGGGIKEDSASQIINRILFLVKNSASDCLTALKNKEKGKLVLMETHFENIRKFILYYNRLLSLSKLGEDEFKFRNRLAVHLNNINSTYKVIGRETLKSRVFYSAKALGFLEKINENLFSTVSLCLKFNKEKALEITQERKKIWQMLYQLKPEQKDYLLLFTLGSILGATSNLIKDRFGLEIQVQ